MGLFDIISGRRAPTEIAAPVAQHAAIVNRREAHFQKRNILSAVGRGRLESSWVNFPTTSDDYIFRNWIALTARARFATEEYDHAKNFVKLIRENVAGNGFLYRPQVMDDNGMPDQAAINGILDAFEDWGRRGNCDVTGTMSLATVERTAVSELATVGETIAVMVKGKDASPWGFALYLMDPFLLPVQLYGKLPNGNWIRHGIEVNAYGRPLNYWFSKTLDPRMSYIQGQAINVSRDCYNVIPASDVIHVYVPERAQQVRGMTWMRTALGRMRMLSGYEDAALTSARIGAAKMGFFQNEDGDDVEDYDLSFDAEPGTLEDIGTRKFVPWDPTYPTGEFSPFVTSCLRSIAAGLGVSYHDLSGDLTSVSFSSIRQGTLDVREYYKGLQGLFISAFCERVYSEWLKYALLSGQIKITGKGGESKALPVEKIAKFKTVQIKGRRWPWIDPNADANANEKMLRLGLKARSDVIEDMGADPWETWSTIAAEKKTMESFGLDPALPAAPGSAPAPNADAAETAEDLKPPKKDNAKK